MAASAGLHRPGLRVVSNDVVRLAEWKPALSCPSRWWEGDRSIFRVKTVRQQCKYLRSKVTAVIDVQRYYFCCSPCIHT